MTFIRVYINSSIILNADLIISGDDYFYLKNVMRIKRGRIVKIFNENDGEFFATVLDITKKDIILHVDKFYKSVEFEKLDSIHLYVSPLRQSRMSMLIEKCVELGVKEITPVIIQNTSFDMDYEKCNLIIKEATEQCERISKLKLNPQISFDDFLKIKHDFIYLKERDENSKFLKDAIGIKNILVGPEGGFSDEEFKKLSESNGISVWLGSLILRAETACIKAISVLTEN